MQILYLRNLYLLGRDIQTLAAGFALHYNHTPCGLYVFLYITTIDAIIDGRPGGLFQQFPC
jgi:hypothetical protein